MIDTKVIAIDVRNTVKQLASFDLAKGFGLSSEKKMVRFPKPVKVIQSPETIKTALRYNTYHYADDSTVRLVTYSKDKFEIGQVTALRPVSVVGALILRTHQIHAERKVKKPA